MIEPNTVLAASARASAVLVIALCACKPAAPRLEVEARIGAELPKKQLLVSHGSNGATEWFVRFDGTNAHFNSFCAEAQLKRRPVTFESEKLPPAWWPRPGSRLGCGRTLGDGAPVDAVMEGAHIYVRVGAPGTSAAATY